MNKHRVKGSMNLQSMIWMEFLHKTALELKIHLLAVGPGLGNVSGTSIENKINQNLLHNYKPTFISFLSIFFTGCDSIMVHTGKFV